jgi:hypothetical protein
MAQSVERRETLVGNRMPPETARPGGQSGSFHMPGEGPSAQKMPLLKGGSFWLSLSLTDISRARFEPGSEQDEEEDGL